MIRNFLLILAVFASFFGAKASKIDTLSIATSYLASPENVVVVTPDIAQSRACPTVYLLNGYDGNHLQWLSTQPKLPELADKYGMIFVLPDGRDSWYWNSPIDPKMQMESLIADRLVEYVDSAYNTIPSPDKRAIAGFSMGGHGAMWLAMHHPDIWKSAGAMSGGLDIRPFPENWKMKQRIGKKEDDPALWDQYTVINLVPSLQPGQLNIIFDCGTDDFFFDVNNNMHSALLEAKIPHDYIVRPGGHTHEYWANALLYQLLFFNEIFNQ